MESPADRVFVMRSPQSKSSSSVWRVAEHLTEHARQYFTAMSEVRSISCETFGRHSTNPLLRFVITDGSTPVSVIAKWAPVYPKNNEGLTEFLNYRQFNCLYGLGSFRCPTPVCFISHENVLITREEQGLPLSRLLRSISQPMASERVIRVVELAAKWLSAFHKLKCPTTVPLSSTVRALKMTWDLLHCDSAAGSTLSAILTKEMENELDRSRMALTTCTEPVFIGGVHGDFGPGNILYTDSEVIVFDTAMAEPDLQLTDVAEFLGYIYAISALRLVGTKSRNRLIETFLRTYFGNTGIGPIQMALLDLLTIGVLIRNIRRQLSAIASLAKPLDRIVAAHCMSRYKRALQGLLFRLRSSSANGYGAKRGLCEPRGRLMISAS